jgi:AcrR family transcriptional regulator
VRGDRTRERILEAALRAASVDGLNGVSIGQVAESANVSKGHLAILFGNREKLQLATLDAAVALFEKHVVEHARAASEPEERLRRFCFGWFDYVQHRVLPGGCLITAATSEFRTIPGAVRDHLIELRRRKREFLRTTINQIRVSKNAAAPRPVEDIVHEIFAYHAAANVAFLLSENEAFEHARRRTEAIVDSVVRGE